MPNNLARSPSVGLAAVFTSMLIVVGVPAAGHAQTPQTLPGGATQLQETHGDWRVTCVQQNDQKVCAFSQQLADSNSRQLVMGIELKATAADKAEGTMVLPFGLAVERPIALQIDEGGSLPPARIRTCLPVGCLANLSFDPATIAALRKGAVLAVKVIADGGQEVSFRISLKGFGSAMDRTAALSK